MPSGNLLVEGGRKGMLVRLEGLRIEVSRETGRTAAFSVCVCVGMGACVCMWRGRSLEVIYLAFETVFLIIPELADQWAPGTCLSPPSQSENCKDVLPCQTPFYKIRVLGIWAQVSGLGSNILSALIHAVDPFSLKYLTGLMLDTGGCFDPGFYSGLIPFHIPSKNQMHGMAVIIDWEIIGEWWGVARENWINLCRNLTAVPKTTCFCCIMSYCLSYFWSPFGFSLPWPAI